MPALTYGRFGMESQLKELQKDAYGFSTLLLHHGDVVLDVGANVGVVSIWLAKLYPGIRIIAIELDPTNFRFMLWNLHRNNAARLRVAPGIAFVLGFSIKV